MTSLVDFLRLVLRVVPPLLWWVLGGLGFAVLNNVLHQEVWPNTPLAQPIFISLMLTCLMLLPGLAARTAWCLSDALESYFWKAIWRFVAVAGYVGAALAVVGGLVAQGVMWHEWMTAH